MSRLKNVLFDNQEDYFFCGNEEDYENENNYYPNMHLITVENEKECNNEELPF